MSMRGGSVRAHACRLLAVLSLLLALGLFPAIAGAADEFGQAMRDGTAARAAGRFPEAETNFREAATLKPDAAEALFALGQALGYQRKFAEAVAVLGRARRLEPGNADIVLTLARHSLWQNRLEEAAQLVAPVVAEHPDNLEARQLAARLDLFRHRLPAAEAGFRAVVAHEPGNAEAWLGLGDSLAARDRAAALAAYRNALKLEPKSTVARQRIAGLARPRAATTAGAKAAAPDPAARLLADGIATRRAGRFSEAEALFRQALALRPDSVEALTGLGLTLGYQGRAADGMREIVHALALAPTNSEVLTAKARLAVWSGDVATARTLLDRVLATQPADSEARAFAARVAVYQRRYEDAKAGFRAVLKAEPGNIEALTGLGDVQAATGAEDDAADSYAQALALHPDLQDIRDRRDRLFDPSGMRWRLDMGNDLSTHPAGYHRSDWQDSFFQLTAALDPRTHLHARLERSDRFNLLDHYYEVGANHRFTPWLSAHLDLGVTLTAQFLPRQRLDSGASVRLWQGKGEIGPTMATLGYRYANYVSGPVARLAPGVQQYFFEGRLWLTAEFPFTRNELDQDKRGWSVRGDLQPLDWARLFAGTGSGSETINNFSVESFSRFAGVTLLPSRRFEVTLAAARTDTVNAPRRDTLGLSLTTRF
ncbi:MAG: tetratricopeptide repeat protein [Rhodospirillaceae bacterium]